MLEIGSLIYERYRILKKIGQSEMSVVYLATDETDYKQIAIKEVSKHGIKDFEVEKRVLVAEPEILTELRHPGILSIIEVFEADNSFIIVMEYWLYSLGCALYPRSLFYI